MILLVLLLALVASVPLTGGRLGRLADIDITAPHLAVLAVAVQIEILEVLPHFLSPAAAAVLHLASYAVAAVFLWWNRRVPGLWLLSLGGGLNLAAIAANAGVMPASPRALRLAGLAVEGSGVQNAGFQNSGAVAHPHLAVLGDIFAVPAGWPLANVFSIGDVLIVIGAGVLLHVASRRPAVGPLEVGVDAGVGPVVEAEASPRTRTLARAASA